MKNRTLFLIFSALILGAVYAYKFTDWFAKKEIQIKYRDMSGRSGYALNSIVFYLEDKGLHLTSLKVISVSEAETNKYPRAYWHLVSDGNTSQLVTDFLYGTVPPGMKPKIAGMNAEPLKAGETYRVLVEAGKLKGEKEFTTRTR